MDVIFNILLFYHSLEADNPKHDSYWNKTSANFKGLTENIGDLASLLKSKASQFAKSIEFATLES